MTWGASDRSRALGFCGLSLALHAALLATLLAAVPRTPPRADPIDVEIVETPAPRPRAPEPPREEPPPRPARPRPQPPAPRKAPTRAEPPRAPAPEEPPPAREEPARVGISMSSTTSAAGLAVATGDTLRGELPGKAPPAAPPGAVGPSSPGEVASLPELVACDVPRSEYPEEARLAGFEGSVRLRIVVGEDGRVLEAKVLHDPGHGLGAQAARNARRYCTFRPARRDGRAVATTIPFTIRFELR